MLRRKGSLDSGIDPNQRADTTVMLLIAGGEGVRGVQCGIESGNTKALSNITKRFGT